MTKKQAIKIHLEVWGYLKDHPTCKDKDNLPEKIYNKIKNLRARCSFCEYIETNNLFCFKDCPLNCDSIGSYWNKWNDAKADKTRKKYATLIYEAGKIGKCKF